MKNETIENEHVPDTIYPDKTIPYDPESEYARICPYDNEKFMANHKLRGFCPQKYGKKDYCKTKYKELQAEARLVANSVPAAQVIKPPQVVTEQAVAIPIVSSTQLATVEVKVKLDPIIRKQIIEKIEELLEGDKWREFSEEEVDQSGLDFSLFDKKIPLPNSNLFRTEIGNYSIFWTHANKLLITKITEILWISQC